LGEQVGKKLFSFSGPELKYFHCYGKVDEEIHEVTIYFSIKIISSLCCDYSVQRKKKAILFSNLVLWVMELIFVIYLAK
jgi:hypothetical protein